MPKRGRASTSSPTRSPPARVAAAIELLGTGRYTEVKRVLVTRFGVSPRTASNDLAAAQRRLAQDVDARLPHLRACVIERLETIIDAAQTKGDLRAAIAGIRELVRLTGVAAPERIEVRDRFADMSFDELCKEADIHRDILLRAAERGHIIVDENGEVVQLGAGDPGANGHSREP